MSQAVNPSHTAFRYMDRFKCIGSSCEDSCCSGGWEIHVDQAHYKKLKKAMDTTPATRREFDGALKRVKDSTQSRAKYALHVLNERGGCKLVRDDGLCSVHARFGESHLSDTCAVYPRAIARSGARLELAGSVSCPEVARQVLLHDDAFDLVACGPEAFTRPLLMQDLGDHPAKPYDRFHDELRNLVVDLLSDARFPLSARLGFVAYLAQRIGAFLDASSASLDENRLAGEIERILGTPMRQELETRLSALSTDASFPAKLVVTLVGARAQNPGAEGFRRLVNTALARYVGQGEHDAAAAAAGYTRAKSEWAAEKDLADQMQANYAKHYWLREWFHGSPSLLAHHIQLLVRLAVIRFVTYGHPLLDGAENAAPAERRDRFARATVDTVQKFSRAFEHDRAFSTLLQNELAAANMITFAHAICLIGF